MISTRDTLVCTNQTSGSSKTFKTPSHYFAPSEQYVQEYYFSEPMSCYINGELISVDSTELFWEYDHTYETADCDTRFHTQIDSNTCFSACPGDSEYDTVLGSCYVNCEEKYNGAKPYLDSKTSTCLNYVEYYSIAESENIAITQILASKHNSLKIDCGLGTPNLADPFHPCVCPDGHQRRTQNSTHM